MSSRVPHHPVNLSNNALLKRSNAGVDKFFNPYQHQDSKAYGLASKPDSECAKELMKWKDGKEERLKLSEKYKKIDIANCAQRLSIGTSTHANSYNALVDIKSSKNKKKFLTKSRKSSPRDINNMIFGTPSKISLSVEALINNQFAQFYDIQLEKKYKELLQKAKKKDKDGKFIKTHSKYYVNQNKIDIVKSKPVIESIPTKNFKLKKFTEQAKPKIDTSLRSDWRRNIPSPYIL